MREAGIQPDAFFFQHRGARRATGELAEVLGRYEPAEQALSHDYWRDEAPQSMLIEEVEALWSAIDERDDWQPLIDKIAAIRRMGEAHGEEPRPLGHGD